MLAAVPFGFLGQNIHYGHAHAFLIASLCLLAALMPSRWIAFFLLYAAGWIGAINLGLFFGMIASPAGITLVLIDGSLYLILGMVFYLAVYHSGISLPTAYGAICITATAQAAIGIFQAVGIDPVFGPLSRLITIQTELPVDAAVGTLGNNNFLGAYLAISLPFFFRGKWALLLPVIIVGLWLSETRTAMIAAVAGFGCWACSWLRDRWWNEEAATRWILAASVIGIVICCLIFASRPVGPRLGYWIDGLRQAFTSPLTALFGFGPVAVWREGNTLHNEYLMTLYNFGAVGLALLIGYIVTAYRGNRLLFTAFIILCVDCIGNHALHTVPTAMLAITICALMDRERTVGGFKP